MPKLKSSKKQKDAYWKRKKENQKLNNEEKRQKIFDDGKKRGLRHWLSRSLGTAFSDGWGWYVTAKQ